MAQTAEQPNASEHSQTAPAASASTADVSIEVLPGVMGTPPSAEAPSEVSTSVTPADPAGGEAAVAAATSATAQSNPAAAPAPEKFSFAGVEFENREKAEHSVKTLRGMHRALERKAEAARVTLLEEQTRRLELEQRLAALESPQRGNGKTGAEGQPAGDPEAPATDEPDWRVFEILVEKHGLPTAMRWLQEANRGTLDSRLSKAVTTLEAKLEERLQPLHETYAEQQELSQTAELFTALANYRTADGREAYPELKETAVMERVGRIWKQLGFPKELLKTAKGLHAAVAVYRDSLAAQATTVTGSPATTTSPAPIASPSAAATAVGNGADGHTPTRPPVPQSEQERMRAEIMAAAVSTNELGFA